MCDHHQHLHRALEQLVDGYGFDPVLTELSKICGEKMHASACDDVGAAIDWYVREAELLAIIEPSTGG
jgi:hypothetical protein